MTTIGQRIKIRREELGLTQEALALRLGYTSKSTINKIEKDGRNLRQNKIKAIADALNTTPSYIMGWDEERKQKEESTLTEKEQILLNLIRQMSDSQIDNLISFLESK